MSHQVSVMCSARKINGSGGRRRVLVVDDYLDGAEAMALYLSVLGFDTRFVTDAHEVYRAAEIHMPHIVLLDIRMPGMDGFDVARNLRTSPHAGPTIIVAYTSMAWSEIEAQALSAGFDGYFRKAADISVLLALLAGYEETVQVEAARPDTRAAEISAFGRNLQA
ncbi:response regulator [Burkholderia sp. 22PA0106]|uniref:response regulator n=1 Tax=Burkholderia sp. 22PA0106 TaxID=3237371 RepID=UPI0039C0C197